MNNGLEGRLCNINKIGGHAVTFRVPFQIRATCGQARCGRLETTHGVVETPAWAPVATQAAVKTLDMRDVAATGTRWLLANAYHLFLRPGHLRISELGGLHRFMGWSGSVLTDSGGFQVFSLAHQRRVEDDAVVFKSHLDGRTVRYTPELAVEIQEALGSDVAMVLDECADPRDRDGLLHALEVTHRWAHQCRAVHRRPDQALFGIVQGGVFEDLRLRSAATLAAMDFAGYAIGGLAVGETKEEMYRTLTFTCPALPEDRPRYLMGVGAPEDVVEAVWLGVDLFDSVMPTRLARNGAVLHPEGRLNLRNAAHAEDAAPIHDECRCYTCRTCSRAYLHHLVRCREISALRLCTLHNVVFMQTLMQDLRDAIGRGDLDAFRAEFHGRYRIADQAARHVQRRLWLASQESRHR